MPDAARHIGARVVVALLSFLVLWVAIHLQPDKRLVDFDQSFYLTIAYDLDRHGVFSNGVFDNTDSVSRAPPPGMFFGPGYPWLVLGAMKVDPRFAEAVKCSVEANQGHRDEATCKIYTAPIQIIHALLLALGVFAIALAGELLFDSRRVFRLAAALATVSLLPDADLFSFVMTESLTFGLYGICALILVLAWKTSRSRYVVLTGGALALLCLTRPSFIVLVPVVAALVFINDTWLSGVRKQRWTNLLAFGVAVAAILGPWMARNAISVGKFGLTEEYGSAALIERFAYDDMTAKEYGLAFPYCTPGIGDAMFDLVYGNDSMHRFVFHTKDSFFHTGRGRRDTLVKEHGRLDPLIGRIALEEMRENWWRYLLVSIPLAWCGLWAGWLAGLITIPLFCWACGRAVRQSRPLFLLYAVPPLVMLALHAAVANHYTRYNLILIGPFAAGAAWIISGWTWRAPWRARAPAPAP